MRVPEISLGYGLLAQNKHDLCRYYKYTERHKQTQYLPAYTVSFMVVPSVRAWEFREKYPELARRLIYAHMLSVEYLYSHPYNAAMMFADGFDVDPYVALRTVYMKTVAEGRTITWQWSEQNMKNNEEFSTQWENPSLPEEDIIFASDSQKSLELSNQLFEDAGIPDFNEFISENIDGEFPLGMTFEDWYNVAKKIDGISDEDAIDISDTATPYLNENLEENK